MSITALKGLIFKSALFVVAVAIVVVVVVGFPLVGRRSKQKNGQR